VSLGSSQVRISISNAFGTAPLTISAVSLSFTKSNNTGIASGSPAIQLAKSKEVTFSYVQKSVTIPRGDMMTSDPISVEIPANTDLSISIYLAHGTGSATSEVTSHPGSRTTSWFAPGDHIGTTDLSTVPGAYRDEKWYFISAVEAMATEDAAAFVIVGDSITDGRGSTTNGNNRWPDILFGRLQKDPRTVDKIAVVNQAAGANKVLSDGSGGTRAVARIKRDVISHKGVKWAMVFEGVNDIAGPPSQSSQGARIDKEICEEDSTCIKLATAFRDMAKTIKDSGIRVFGGTITPFRGNDYYNKMREQTRNRTNTWIRKSGVFDAVVDFDQAVREKDKLSSRFDSGDHLHLSPAGLEALANAVDLSIFVK
jgi:lysophospholipase L1-like esterase